MRYLLVILLLVVAIGNPVLGQETENGDENNRYSVACSFHKGRFIAHRKVLEGLVENPSKAIAISIEKRFSGEKYWHSAYNRPSLGLDLTYCDLGNTEELGEHTSAVLYLKFPLGAHSKLNHSIKSGIGLGYANTIWDLKENTKSLVISTHFNVVVF